MKADATWRKVTRRSAALAVGACCLAVLTGCPWDEDDEELIPPVPTQWEVAWNPDPSGISPQTIVVPWSDLTAAEALDEMITANGITYHVTLVPGPPLVITISDTTSSAQLILTSTSLTPDQASGSYTGTDPGGSAIPAGTWTVIKK